MRSELQFFMLPDDEDELVHLASELSEKIDKKSDIQWFFCIGDARIQLLRSKREKSDLISGRISIATNGFGTEVQSAELAERVYKKLRNWLKKSYSNKVTGRNINIPNSDTEIKTMWISPRVIELCRIGEITLKQSSKGFVVYEASEA